MLARADDRVPACPALHKGTDVSIPALSAQNMEVCQSSPSPLASVTLYDVTLAAEKGCLN